LVKALVWLGPERMALEEQPPPKVPPGSVLVRSRAAGICGSEVEGYLGRMGNRRPPLVMGHEFAGEVVQLGEGVDPRWQRTRVAVNPIVSCGRCAACRAGDTNLCARRALIGIARPGGFAELVEVPEPNLFELPADADDRIGALVEPMANGVHAVRLGMSLGAVERAAVIGAGMIGLACLQAALAGGVETLAVIEPHTGRRERARALGAHATHSSVSEAGEDYDLVLDAAGAAATRQAAVELVRNGGVCVFLGLHEDETALSWHRVIRNQVTVRGSFAYSRDDFQTALNWLVSQRIGIGELPAPVPLEHGPDAFAELARGPIDQVKVFLTS
jgi:2-desacetyl-2-hydroxyethyl bacteriochlorophyllide A dehydrogenase